MGKINKFIVNSWVKYDGANKAVVMGDDFGAYVLKQYGKDFYDDGEGYLLEDCELVIKQDIDVDDSTYASFMLRERFLFEVEIDSNEKWKIKNDNYSVQNSDDKLRYEQHDYAEKIIREKINNNKRLVSNTWELRQDDKTKKYEKWEPFKIVYNCVLEDSHDIAGVKNIYAGIIFDNEQYEVKLLISKIAIFGRKKYTDEELTMPELSDLRYDEDYYMGDVFITITNKTTSKSIKYYREEADPIKDFILIKQKSSIENIVKKHKQKSKVEMGDYIDLKLFDNKD